VHAGLGIPFGMNLLFHSQNIISAGTRGALPRGASKRASTRKRNGTGRS
jgi:hypothetical protein